MRKTIIKIIKIIFFLSIFFNFACNESNCDELPTKYSSFDEAVITIKKASFEVEESCNTSKSSWVLGASYYSCNGSTGFFILKTANQDYLYSGVPLDVWKGFKKAESFGSYYNNNIKGHYTFRLNQ